MNRRSHSRELALKLWQVGSVRVNELPLESALAKAKQQLLCRLLVDRGCTRTRVELGHQPDHLVVGRLRRLDQILAHAP
ncbi:MAG TPA: hypothetical protein VIJ84_03325, partial [Gaiellaceae bacterium]